MPRLSAHTHGAPVVVGLHARRQHDTGDARTGRNAGTALAEAFPAEAVAVAACPRATHGVWVVGDVVVGGEPVVVLPGGLPPLDVVWLPVGAPPVVVVGGGATDGRGEGCLEGPGAGPVQLVSIL